MLLRGPEEEGTQGTIGYTNAEGCGDSFGAIIFFW
jgi:hypothetical protein